MPACKPLTLRGRLLGAEKSPLVCVPLVGRNAPQLLDELDRVRVARPDLIEWRADFLEESLTVAQWLAIAAQLQAAAAELPLIFTWRSAAEGGQVVANDAASVCEINTAMAASGLFALIDLESASDRGSRRAVTWACTGRNQAALASRRAASIEARKASRTAAP